ncbi:PREDICTED: protein YLS3 isoform X1 [Populus euphratica]|uniref:Protein YLS3 isoform X1 n=1 Tax=Populus euphratica TaxID=75702 RepID=A0AAJ6VET2_POPEU|nr:PREDICTED: protein YLS3 isoform X1 [Populus euphratica]
MARTMCSEVVHVMVSSIVVLMMFNFVFSDLAADKRECNEQLASLSACLPFVGGDTKVPPPTCCSGLRQEISKTEKCLCIIVKDRNEPDLGFKINATLALSLPSICNAPANVSACPEMLHLAPNSTDAQVFEDFAASNKSNAAVAGDRTSSSNTMKEKKWLEVSMVAVITSALTIAG